MNRLEDRFNSWQRLSRHTIKAAYLALKSSSNNRFFPTFFLQFTNATIISYLLRFRGNSVFGGPSTAVVSLGDHLVFRNLVETCLCLLIIID